MSKTRRQRKRKKKKDEEKKTDVSLIAHYNTNAKFQTEYPPLRSRPSAWYSFSQAHPAPYPPNRQPKSKGFSFTVDPTDEFCQPASNEPHFPPCHCETPVYHVTQACPRRQMPVKQEPILFPMCLCCGEEKREQGKRQRKKERADKRRENISKSCSRVTQSPIVPKHGVP